MRGGAKAAGARPAQTNGARAARTTRLCACRLWFSWKSDSCLMLTKPPPPRCCRRMYLHVLCLMYLHVLCLILCALSCASACAHAP